MDAYTHEKEQIDQIKAWWKENWLFIVGGIVVAIGSIGGWRAWQAYELERAQAASSLYAEMLVQVAANNDTAVDKAYTTLKNDFGNTVYALLAALKRADIELDAGNAELAAGELRWAMESGIDRELQLLARLRLARVLLASGDTEAVLALTGEAVNPGRFQASLDEVRGDAHYMMGNADAARDAYQSALSAVVEGSGSGALLQAKIDNIAMPVEAVAVTGDVDAGGDEE